MVETTFSVPAEGEIFELTLDGSAPENDPIEMVRRDGFTNPDPERWEYTGKKIEGICTRRFKLVRVGYCRNLDEVRQKLEVIPEGQWREALKVKYRRPDGKGFIGFADPAWVYPYSVYPYGYRCFPYLFNDGLDDGEAWNSSFFLWADHGLYGYWRWLVEVS